jgi:hypothetical protein
VGAFGTLSPHPKIPFPASGFGREFGPRSQPQLRFSSQRIRDVEDGLGLFRIEAQGLELPAPFSRRVAEPLDADATGQATFHRRMIRG